MHPPAAGGTAGGFFHHTAGLPAHLFGGDAKFLEHFDRLPFSGAGECKQKVFRADKLMPHQAGFFNGEFQHLLGAFGKFNGGGFDQSHRGEAFHHFADALGFKPQLAQGCTGGTAIFLDQVRRANARC